MTSVSHVLGIDVVPETTVSKRLSRRKLRHVQERIIEFILFLAALVSVATTVGIVLILLKESYDFFQVVSLWDFLTDTQWTPLFSDAHYGIAPLLSGTLVSSTVALLVAIPLGTIIAIYLSEFAPFAVREVAKPFLEMLGGIPTIVYGYFALLFVTPLLRKVWEDIAIFNALSASLVMGIMILPMISSLSEDAMRAVPRSLRDAAYALGATKLEVATRVVTPAALSGIAAAFILAMSRAIGETMVVTIAAGQNPNFTLNPFVPVETMTAYIVQVSLGDAPSGTLEYKTIFAVGLSLFVITLGMNLLSQLFVRRFREVYQ